MTQGQRQTRHIFLVPLVRCGQEYCHDIGVSAAVHVRTSSGVLLLVPLALSITSFHGAICVWLNLQLNSVPLQCCMPVVMLASLKET